MTAFNREDAFSISGYRHLLARLMAVSLRDLNSGDASRVNDAKFWFDAEKGADRAITVDDCLTMLGYKSTVSTVRDIAFSGDKFKIEQLASTLELTGSDHAGLFEEHSKAHVNTITADPDAVQTLQAAFR